MSDPATSASTGPAPGGTRFRVSPMSYIGLAVMILALLVPVAEYPLALSWLVLLPIGFAWWVARTRTLVTESGLVLTSWRSKREVPWEDVAGVSFPRASFGRVVTTDDRHITMGGVGFSDLPELSVASRGRIPDPHASAAAGRE